MSAFIFFFIFLFACGGQKIRRPSTTISSRQEQQKLFEHYRQMRKNNWKAYLRAGKLTGKSYPKTRKKKRPLTKKQKEEIRARIAQYSAYFCFKKRKVKKFSQESACNAYTQEIIRSCKEHSDEEYSKHTPYCIKKAFGI